MDSPLLRTCSGIRRGVGGEVKTLVLSCRVLSVPGARGELRKVIASVKEPGNKISLSVAVSLLLCVAVSALAALTGKFWLLFLSLGVLTFIGLALPSSVVPFLLIAATIAMPFVNNLSGKESDTKGVLIAFGFTDLLLFAAIPGALRLLWMHRKTLLSTLPTRVRCYLLWSTLFLVICTVSFLLNRNEMLRGVMIYAVGGLRTFQTLILIPLAFAVCAWNEQQFRWLWTGYCTSVLFFIVTAIGMYAVGITMVPILGVNQNVAGLIIVTGVIVALFSHRYSRNERLIPKAMERIILILGMPALVIVGSRSSQIALIIVLVLFAIRFRCPKLPILLLLALVTSMYVGARFSSSGSPKIKSSVSLQERSIQERFEQIQRSIGRIKQSPLFGDGLRARKDITPHNLEILILTETGILGLLAFSGVLLTIGALFHETLQQISDKPLLAATIWILAVCSLSLIIHAHADPFWRRGPLWLMAASIGICWSLLRQKDEYSLVSEA